MALLRIDRALLYALSNETGLFCDEIRLVC